MDNFIEFYDKHLFVHEIFSKHVHEITVTVSVSIGDHGSERKNWRLMCE